MRRRHKMKIRKSLRSSCIAFCIICCLISLINIIRSFGEKDVNYRKEDIYSYSNKMKYEYSVNLKDNPYISHKTLGMKETAYVTDLIDTIDLNLDYNYNASKESDVKYKYKVTGKLQGIYTKDGEEQRIINEEYPLIEEKEEISKQGKFELLEKLTLDLKDKNALIRSFEQEMNMNITATYLVIIDVQTSTNIDGQDVENKYSSNIAISLASKTTEIVPKKSDEKIKSITKDVEESVDSSKVGVFINIIIFVISSIGLSYILTKTMPSNIITNGYKKELNKILRLCEDKIVQVNSKFEVEKDNVVDVRDFGEIIKISEELFKPILYWNSDEESYFMVISSNINYRYILRNE